MTTATIKLFLPGGDAKSLRTAEISNWTGKAIAAPRTELDELLQREELDKVGVYILSGSDPLSGSPRAYIGEAEVIRERLKQHKTKEFWISAIVFVSKDENLTKAHVRYLENRVLTEAAQVGRCTLEQKQAGGSKLPESDREDMEVFLSHIRQLLPVLGSDLLIPIAQPAAKQQSGGMLFCRMKGAEGRGRRTPDGFVVFRGSTAVLQERESAKKYPYVLTLRNQLIDNGTLIKTMASTSLPRMQSFLVLAPRQQSLKEAVQMDLLSGELTTGGFSKNSTNRPNQLFETDLEPARFAPSPHLLGLRIRRPE